MSFVLNLVIFEVDIWRDGSPRRHPRQDHRSRSYDEKRSVFDCGCTLRGGAHILNRQRAAPNVHTILTQF